MQGALSFSETHHFLKEIKKNMTEDDIKEAFREMDEDGEGVSNLAFHFGNSPAPPWVCSQTFCLTGSQPPQTVDFDEFYMWCAAARCPSLSHLSTLALLTTCAPGVDDD